MAVTPLEISTAKPKKSDWITVAKLGPASIKVAPNIPARVWRDHVKKASKVKTQAEELELGFDFLREVLGEDQFNVLMDTDNFGPQHVEPLIRNVMEAILTEQ